jgi:hypothetical protein
MSMTRAHLRAEAIRTLLAQRAGKAADAKAIAKAAVDIWPEVTARLAPVIGERGVDAIFRRALHQTSAAFPWLQIAGDRGSVVSVLGNLETCLAGQKTAAAAAASQRLLMTFTELLAAMIGESLTERLLGPVWAAPPLPASEQETGS